MNPLKSFMSPGNSPVNGILQMLNGGVNPQALANQLLQSNPQARLFLQQIQNQANGRSPREMAIQYAHQYGISDEELMRLASRMGLK